MAHDIFVSYSHKDKPVADAVVAGLEQKGVRCWIAPRDVMPGTSWGDAIIGAIETSRIMVVILSGNSNQSRQVVREVERAVAKGVIIIPFRIEKIDPTGAMAYFLSTEHWLDALTPPLEEHIEKLGSTVQLFLTEGAIPVTEVRPRDAVVPPAPTAHTRRYASLGVSLLGIVIITALGITFLPGLIKDNPSSSPTPSIAVAPPTETAPPPTPTPVPPPEFAVIGEYRTSGSAFGLFVTTEHMLALANGVNGLAMLDVSDPANPRLDETYPVGDLPAKSVFIDGDTAYVVVGDDRSELVILQLSEAGLSAKLPDWPIMRNLYHVTVTGDFAHLTSHNYWGILDVKNPMQPKEIWTWEPPEHSGNPCTAAVQGSVAYIGCGWAGLFTFDITNPHNPELLGQFNTPDWIIDIAIADQVLYLTLGDSGLLSLDITDPTKPLFLNRINLPGFSSDISVSEDTLYVIYALYEGYVVQESGVNAVNVRNPEEPVLIATYNKLNTGSDIQAVNDVIFVTDDALGVIILSLDVHE